MVSVLHCVCLCNSSMKACMYPCMCALVAGMGILERKPLEECNEELKAKFWPTYKVCGVVAWRETVVFPPHSPVLFVQSFQGWSWQDEVEPVTQACSCYMKCIRGASLTLPRPTFAAPAVCGNGLGAWLGIYNYWKRMPNILKHCNRSQTEQCRNMRSAIDNKGSSRQDWERTQWETSIN